MELQLTQKETLLILVALDSQVAARPLDKGWLELKAKVSATYQERYLAEAVASMGGL